MKKYWHVIGIGIQNNLTYRVNYLSRTLFSFIPLFAMLSLWRTVYAGKEQGSALGGYTQAQMIFYYLLVAVVDVLTAVNEDDWQIAADIREGNISQFLLKPIDYLWYRLCLFFSGRITFIAMACVPLGIFIFCFRAYFVRSGQRKRPAALCDFAAVDGAAAILYFLHHGHAGVLAAGNFHVHLYPVRVRIPCQRPFVSARPAAAGDRACALFYAVPVHALRAHCHLHG